MDKHTIFVGMMMALVGAIAFQSMRADAVPGAPELVAQAVSPMEIMKNARDLPVERIDYPY